MPVNATNIATDSASFFKKLSSNLSRLLKLEYHSVDHPLLSKTEINQLISKSGSSNKFQLSTGNQTFQSGEQASTIRGSGLDFADRRRYVAGDDPRLIDWRASARSQQTLVKNYYTEVNIPGCIIIDRRSSMAFGSSKRLKVTQAIRAGITVGTRILRGGHPLACLILDTAEYWQPPQNSLALFRQTINFAARACPPDELTDEPQDLKSGWSKISQCLLNKLPAGSRLVIISDFFQLGPTDLKALQHLSHRYNVSVIQVIDQVEQALPPVKNISLHYRQMSLQALDNKKMNQQFNCLLQQKLGQLENWFTTNNCQFLRLYSHDNLDAVRANF